MIKEPNRASPILLLQQMLLFLFLIGQGNTPKLGYRFLVNEMSRIQEAQKLGPAFVWANRTNVENWADMYNWVGEGWAVSTFAGWLLLLQRAWWRENAGFKVKELGLNLGSTSHPVWLWARELTSEIKCLHPQNGDTYCVRFRDFFICWWIKKEFKSMVDTQYLFPYIILEFQRITTQELPRSKRKLLSKEQEEKKYSEIQKKMFKVYFMMRTIQTRSSWKNSRSRIIYSEVGWNKS